LHGYSYYWCSLTQFDYTALSQKFDKLEKTVELLIDTTKNTAMLLGNDFMSADEIQKLNKKAEDRAKELSIKESKQHQLLMLNAEKQRELA